LSTLSREEIDRLYRKVASLRDRDAERATDCVPDSAALVEFCGKVAGYVPCSRHDFRLAFEAVYRRHERSIAMRSSEYGLRGQGWPGRRLEVLLHSEDDSKAEHGFSILGHPKIRPDALTTMTISSKTHRLFVEVWLPSLNEVVAPGEAATA
jgi:hypothetical protein